MKNIIRTYFSTLSRIAPRLAGHQAFELFQRPLNKKLRPKEMSFFKAAKSFFVRHHLEDIQCYELGSNSGELVILVHGWESNAASMSAIGLELAEKGFHVILFNLPAHGFSKLKKTNLKLSKEALLAVIGHINPLEPFSIVAHSFGSAVTAYSLSKTSYHVNNLVFLTCPDKLSQIFDDFGKLIGLSPKAQKILENKASALLNEPLRDISTQSVGPKVNYRHLTIIHDEADKVIPKYDSINIYNHWDRSTIQMVQNKGHYRMLWDSEVIDLVHKALTVNKIHKKETQLTSAGI